MLDISLRTLEPRTLVFPDPVGPITLDAFQPSDHNPVGEDSHNDKVIRVCLETVFEHDILGVKGGRQVRENCSSWTPSGRLFVFRLT